MAQRIVYLFEAIEVHQKKPKSSLVPARCQDGTLQALVDQSAIGEIGEAIVQRAMLDDLQGGRPLGDQCLLVCQSTFVVGNVAIDGQRTNRISLIITMKGPPADDGKLSPVTRGMLQLPFPPAGFP